MISNVISVSLVREGALFPTPFPGNPLTYVIRTISEFNAIAESKKSDCLAIYKGDFLEIDGHLALFLFEQFSKRFHALSVNPSTHSQHNNVLSSHQSLDSQRHRLPQSLSIVDHASGCLPRAFQSRIANLEPFVRHWK